MTGVLNAMVGGGNKQTYSVTIASLPGPSFGMNDSVPGGSVTPTSFRGATIKVAASRTGNDNFTFTLNGALAQSFIQSVLVQRTDGAWALFKQQDVSFFASGPSVTIWQWGAGGADPAWTSTSPSPRQILVAF